MIALGNTLHSVHVGIICAVGQYSAQCARWHQFTLRNHSSRNVQTKLDHVPWGRPRDCPAALNVRHDPCVIIYIHKVCACREKILVAAVSIQPLIRSRYIEACALKDSQWESEFI